MEEEERGGLKHEDGEMDFELNCEKKLSSLLKAWDESENNPKAE
jgi:hypothetical protein